MLYKSKLAKNKAETKQDTVTLTPDQISIPEDLSTKVINKKDDIPVMKIYFEGWVKYFRFIDVEGGTKPDKFFRNDVYDQQNPQQPENFAGGANPTPAPNATNIETDKFGTLKIPDEKHFFAVVYNDTVNILTARENPISNVIDTLHIDFIKSIPEDNNYLGGVKDFGSFSEGSCVEVRTIKPATFFKMTPTEIEPKDGLREVWVICLDNETKKKQLMDIIIKLKLRKQHEQGAYIFYKQDPRRPTFEQQQQAIQDFYQTKRKLTGDNVDDPVNSPNRSPNDGYWILLQDWGQCTLKCGGGLQYRQLVCVPPKGNGKPCEGPSIRTRPCNEQPCPDNNYKVIKTDLVKNAYKPKITETISKAVIKVMPFSTRPQRYDKCYLKEADALMVKNDFQTVDFSILPKVPVRVVMNNKSVTIYQDDTLQTNIANMMLSRTTYQRVKDDARCFILNSNNNRVQLCQIDSSSVTANNFVEEWDYDFNLFKNQCNEHRSTYDIDATEFDKAMKKKMEDLKNEMVTDKAKQIREKQDLDNEVTLQKKVQQTQSVTLNAIQKEDRLEQLLEKEEADREREEQQELRMQFENEKKKDECLMKSIKEKQLEDQYNISKANTESEIEKIKLDAQREIFARRQKVKKRLDSMRKKNDRVKAQIRSDILLLRSEVAGKLQKITRAGNVKNCFVPDASNMDKVEQYCQINYADNITKFGQCKSIDGFCYACCENEFGEMHLIPRDNCYRRCDNWSKLSVSAHFMVKKK
jgi:hypothetical protein